MRLLGQNFEYLILHNSVFEISKVYNLLVCKDMGIRKSEFVGETNFLENLILRQRLNFFLDISLSSCFRDNSHNSELKLFSICCNILINDVTISILCC